MSSIEALRKDAERVYVKIVELAKERREIVRKIAELKRALGSPSEDYSVEIRNILNSKPDGQLWRLASAVIMDSLQAQGLKTISKGRSVEDSTISSCEPEVVGVDEIKNEIKGLVGERPEEILGPRQLVIISWAIGMGLGKPAVLVGPLPRYYESVFWAIGSRPYRAFYINELRKFDEVSPLVFIRSPDLYGRVSPYLTYPQSNTLIDSTHIWIGKGTLLGRGSIMAVPGTEGTPWEATAVFFKGIKEHYEALGLQASDIVLRCRPKTALDGLVKKEMAVHGKTAYKWEAGPFLSYLKRIKGHSGISGAALGFPGKPWSYNVVKSQCQS